MTIPRPGAPRSGGGTPADLALAAIEQALREGLLERADELAREFCVRHPRRPEGRLLRAVASERAMDRAAALEHARASIAIAEHPEAWMVISRVLRARGETDGAIDACDRALAFRPGFEPWLVHRAGTLEEAGRFAEARAVVDPLIARCEREGLAISPPLRFEFATLLVQERSYERAVAVIDELLASDSTHEQLARIAYYLKAKALDRSGRYDEAFKAASAGNEIGRIEFDPSLYERQVSQLIENWSRERIERFPMAACDDEMPVFVAGMPRSGTSLIDQVIDAHPLAAGVGELASIEQFAARLSRSYDPGLEPPACFVGMGAHEWSKASRAYIKQIRSLAPPGARRVVNKALGNNKLVGLLARLFPRTRIIHALRDPRDVAISCYMGGFNNRIHPWTTRLDWTAAAWEQSRRLMEHWRRVLDVPILDVHYEHLVSDPEGQFPRLIEFLGLPWDPACLEFYKSKRTVRTLSYDQVNRPLYTTSAGRHANYARHFAHTPPPDLSGTS